MKNKIVSIILILSGGILNAQNVGIGTTTPVARLHVVDSSVLFSAPGDIPAIPGLPPMQGAGRRMMWYPGKAAFRVGYVNNSQWDQNNIGNYSFASGIHTHASGVASTAMGFGAFASGSWSTAIGFDATATAPSATSIGDGTTASGTSSLALGYNTTASGGISVAMGSGTIASGIYSAAMGNNTTASGDISIAMGYFTMSKGYSSTVVGMYNDSLLATDQTSVTTTTPLFVVGNGSSFSSRSNALVVSKDGKIYADPGGKNTGTLTDNALVFGAYNNTGEGISSKRTAGGNQFGIDFYTSYNNRMTITNNGNIGVGTISPTAKLHIVHTSGGITNPQLLLFENSAGYSRLNFMNASGSSYWAIAGLSSAINSSERLNFFNSGTGDIMSITGNGRVGIGNSNPASTLDVTGNLSKTGNFINTASNYGVYGGSNSIPGSGVGVQGEGGGGGVVGYAMSSGPGDRYGVFGAGSNGAGQNYGVSGTAGGGTIAYGIYGSASNAATNYAGYFQGDVFSSGNYLPSDRKLKTGITKLSTALLIINQLNPTFYTYNTIEYKQMHLPEGLHYGLIADEVQKVMPEAVKKAVQPAQYEYHDQRNGKKISEEIEFNAVNYTEIIPILIGGMKEQQVLIEKQQQQINELLKEIQLIKEKLK
jgi:hypothetical protein